MKDVADFVGALEGHSGPRIGRAFAGLLWRDTFVTGKELPSFLAQVLVQPLFFLFVFGRVLGDLGYIQSGFAAILLPGIVGFTAFLTALQNTAFPLVIEFSYTKEIEDRLLAPLPTSLVAVEKVIFATLRALIAAALIFPLGRWILGELPLSLNDVPAVAGVTVLGSLVGAATGLALGTLVRAERMSIIFTLAMAPLMFTGAIQFPWPSLELVWFKVLCAINPLTYVSESLRGIMLENVPHIPLEICLPTLVGFLAALMSVGIWGFRRRALD